MLQQSPLSTEAGDRWSSSQVTGGHPALSSSPGAAVLSWCLYPLCSPVSQPACVGVVFVLREKINGRPCLERCNTALLKGMRSAWLVRNNMLSGTVCGWKEKSIKVEKKQKGVNEDLEWEIRRYCKDKEHMSITHTHTQNVHMGMKKIYEKLSERTNVTCLINLTTMLLPSLPFPLSLAMLYLFFWMQMEQNNLLRALFAY